MLSNCKLFDRKTIRSWRPNLRESRQPRSKTNKPENKVQIIITQPKTTDPISHPPSNAIITLESKLSNCKSWVWRFESSSVIKKKAFRIHSKFSDKLSKTRWNRETQKIKDKKRRRKKKIEKWPSLPSLDRRLGSLTMGRPYLRTLWDWRTLSLWRRQR